jgi:hypothetical protein
MVDNTPVVVSDDPSAGIAIAALRIKNGVNVNSTLVTSDPSIPLKMSGVPMQIKPMSSQNDVNTIQMTTNQFQDFNFIGNNAFSITPEILQQIIKHPPSLTRLVTESSYASFPAGHSKYKKESELFHGLVESTGLKAVYFLPDKFFTQYKADGTAGDKAQIGTMVIHCERGYNGLIDVYNSQEQLIYQATRTVKCLPRTVEAYNLSRLPELNKSWNGKPSIWNNAGGYSKTNESQARIDLVDRMSENDVRIIIPHQNNGTPGKPETYWPDEKLGLHTTTAEALDPMQYLEWSMFVMSFGKDTTVNRAKRDSILSLMKTRYFAIAYQCMAPSALGGPALEYLLKKFPSDRIWDQEEVKNYVRSNTPA